jgi:protein-disulfide isomerase
MMKSRRQSLGLLLILLCCVFPAAAQDTTDPALTEVQQVLRGFANWWLQSQETPDHSVMTYRAEDGAFMMGNPLAPITIVEFADFACPHCQRYRPAMAQFIESYVVTGMAKVEFRLFPTAGGALTVAAGKAAECADAQRAGAFWQAHDLLYDYALSGRYDDTIPSQLALDLRLNETTLRTCMETVDQVETDVALARELGIAGTPTVMVRYSSGIPAYIEMDGVTYRSGGPTFDVLSAVVEEGQFR